MKEAVEKIVKSLVDKPEEVAITEDEHGKNVTIKVQVAEGDVGRAERSHSAPSLYPKAFGV